MSRVLDEPTSASHWQQLAQTRLERVLGVPKATLLLAQTLAELGLATLDSADHLAQFGEVLARRGGFLAALGVSLQTQALLHVTRPKQ